jgi:peroxin-14
MSDKLQRYVMPLVAPPTPEKLEQDKKTIEDQFDRAFALVEQLAKDTESLKKAEEQRTERLDTALSELESVMNDLKSANRRREDDAQRIRDEVQSLKDAIPKALGNQKDLTDNRLREINGELTSLKTLVSQRMSHSAAPASPAATPNPLRPSGGVGAISNTSIGKTAVNGGDKAEPAAASPSTETPRPTSATTSQSRPSISKDNQGSKASIPAWQMAFAKQSEGSSSSAAATPNGTKTEAEATASAS